MKQKDDVEEMEIEPDELDNALHGLICGFCWKHSKEGTVYWNKIHRRLLEIKEKGR